MDLLFVDTAGWVMMVDGADRQHSRACRHRDGHLERGGVLVTSDYVVDETLTLLRMRLGLDVAESWWRMVSGSRRVRFEAVDAQRAERAREIFFGWRDKAFSFTDCTSFVLMRELRISSALTSDRHFSQAGFAVAP